MRAVEMRSRGDGYGWKPYRAPRRNGVRSGTTPGLLLGGGGIVLALLAATGDASADWDRALGVSAKEVGASTP
jgi:hypothetical protein